MPMQVEHEPRLLRLLETLSLFFPKSLRAAGQTHRPIQMQIDWTWPPGKPPETVCQSPPKVAQRNQQRSKYKLAKFRTFSSVASHPTPGIRPANAPFLDLLCAHGAKNDKPHKIGV